MIWFSTAAMACEPVGVASLMDMFATAITDGHPEAALDRVEVVWQGLPGACSPVPGDDLALIAQRAGALAWDLGRPEVSDRWFESACRLAPNAAMPASLGPTAAGRASAACERVGGRGVGEVVVESSVVIDGVPRAPGDRFSLPIGVHLLVRQEAGAWTGRWQTVEDGLPLGLPSGNLVLPTPPRTAPRLGAPLALVGGGAVLAGVGGLVLQLLFADPWNRDCASHGFGFADWQACEEQRDVPLSAGWYGGVGLIAGGAAVGLTGVGLGVHALHTDSGAGLTLTFPL